MCNRGEAHHWLLGDTEDGEVPPHCRKCGRTRRYTVIIVDDWNSR